MATDTVLSSGVVYSIDDVATDEEPEFIPMSGQNGAEHLVRSALADRVILLNLWAANERARTVEPSFVPAELMLQFMEGQAPVVTELCRSGMWERVDGGYRITDSKLVETRVAHARLMQESPTFCVDINGGHRPFPSTLFGAYGPDGFQPRCFNCWKLLVPTDQLAPGQPQ